VADIDIVYGRYGALWAMTFVADIVCGRYGYGRWCPDKMPLDKMPPTVEFVFTLIFF